MISFFAAIIVLIVGYLIYGKFVERVFGIDDSLKTPAIEMQDGVDYVPMNWKKIFLIQFLYIAGLGPIFGAIHGALFSSLTSQDLVLSSELYQVLFGDQ